MAWTMQPPYHHWTIGGSLKTHRGTQLRPAMGVLSWSRGGDLDGRSHLFCLLAGIVQGTDVHKRAFWEVVALAAANALKAVDSLVERGGDAGQTGEDLTNVERLAEESLQLART